MKIAPLSTSDPWLGRILEDKDTFAQGLRGVPVESTVEVELVEILHGRPQDNYRPYLHIRGEIVGVRPDVELPYGVEELGSRRGSGTRVDAFYEFDQRQLVELVSKGYFTEGFEVPEALVSVPWELPMEADFVVVGPRTAEEVPIVFMGLSASTGLDIDQATSGYDLSSYFPDQTPEAEQEEQVEFDEDGLAHDGSGRDLFADDDISNVIPIEDRLVQAREAAVGPVAPERVFDRLVEEVAATIPLSEEIVEDFELPTEADIIYDTEIAPVVDRVIGGDHGTEANFDMSAATTEATTEAATVEAVAETVQAVIPEPDVEASAQRADEAIRAAQEAESNDFFSDDDPEAEEEELAPEPIRIEPEVADAPAEKPKTSHEQAARESRWRGEQARRALAEEAQDESLPGDGIELG